MRVQTLADVVGVAAVGGRHHVGFFQHRGGGDADCFLPVAAVDRSTRAAFLVQAAQAFLDAAYDDHLAMDLDQFFRRGTVLHFRSPDARTDWIVFCFMIVSAQMKPQVRLGPMVVPAPSARVPIGLAIASPAA